MNKDKQVSVPLPDSLGPVPPGQIESLCRALSAESNPERQRYYWSLLQHSAPSSKALTLALESIINPAAPNRAEAVRYLRICFPDRLPGLLEAFSKDPDEELRYQLSEFLRDSDQDAAVGMKIGMLQKASPGMQEILIAEIAQFGSLIHLEALHGIQGLPDHGPGSATARAGEQLGKRIRIPAAEA